MLKKFLPAFLTLDAPLGVGGALSSCRSMSERRELRNDDDKLSRVEGRRVFCAGSARKDDEGDYVRGL